MIGCPACDGPIIAHELGEGRIGVCRWCGAVLVGDGADTVRVLTDAEASRLPERALVNIKDAQNAVRTFGAARRN